ncbi:TRAP transporter small permease [Aquimixticola soesokkakensis]|nr:TRAP transporter small permease subunit [Aquimixticola soesokkakensis]
MSEGGGFGRLLLRVSGAVDRVLETSGALIIGVTLTAAFAALLANVVLRYVFGEGMAWAYEIHAILFPWLVAGGVVVASVKSRHISVTVLVDILPPSLRRALWVLVCVLICAIAIGVLRTSGPIINAAKFQRLSGIPVTQYWGYLSLYYTFGAMALNAGLAALRGAFAYEDPMVDPTQTSFS